MNTGSRDIDSVRPRALESELRRATDMVRQGNARYWLAYCRGLRRGFGGPEAVSDAEHQRWLRLHPALHREELAGYSDALLSVTTVVPTKLTTGAPCAPAAAGDAPTADGYSPEPLSGTAFAPEPPPPQKVSVAAFVPRDVGAKRAHAVQLPPTATTSGQFVRFTN
jgi:hypothetical protein